MKKVTRLLREAFEPHRDRGALPSDRDDMIATIAEALTARRRQKRRTRIAISLAAAALVVLAGWGLMTRAPHESVAVVAAPRALDLGRLESSGAPVAEGTELSTSEASETNLAFSSGTRITIGGVSRVRLVEQTKAKRFALDEGSFSASVAKLAPDERFVVATPDAEVEVRGTAFRVRVVPSDAACGDGTQTRLEVTEGVVVVRRGGAEVRVSAGEHWPLCAPPVAMSAPRPAPPPRPTATASGSHLVEQNNLFDEAMRRKKSGDSAGAVVLLDRLLSLYPDGALAQAAVTERRRLTAVDAGGR